MQTSATAMIREILEFILVECRKFNKIRYISSASSGTNFWARSERKTTLNWLHEHWRFHRRYRVRGSFERLSNLARETLKPVWSLNKVFLLKNLVIKSLKKIRCENIQKRRPRGSLIKHGEIWPAKFGQLCLPQIFQVYLLHLSQL